MKGRPGYDADPHAGGFEPSFCSILPVECQQRHTGPVTLRPVGLPADDLFDYRPCCRTYLIGQGIEVFIVPSPGFINGKMLLTHVGIIGRIFLEKVTFMHRYPFESKVIQIYLYDLPVIVDLHFPAYMLLPFGHIFRLPEQLISIPDTFFQNYRGHV